MSLPLPVRLSILSLGFLIPWLIITVSRSNNSANFRSQWTQSQNFLRYVRALETGAAGATSEDLCKFAFGYGYYRQTIGWKWDLRLFFLSLWALLQAIAIFTSPAFREHAVKGEAGAIALVLLGVLASLAAAYFQRHDGRMPSPRAKLLHGVSSLSSAVVYVAWAAYDFKGTWSKPADRSSLVSGLLLAISGVVLSWVGIQLLMTEVTDILREATWTEILSLLWYRIPPDSLMWECVPDKEKVWALETIMKSGGPTNTHSTGGPSGGDPPSHPPGGDPPGDTSPNVVSDVGSLGDPPTGGGLGGSLGGALTASPSETCPRSDPTVPGRSPSGPPPVETSVGTILTDKAPDPPRLSGRVRRRPDRYGWNPAYR